MFEKLNLTLTLAQDTPEPPAPPSETTTVPETPVTPTNETDIDSGTKQPVDDEVVDDNGNGDGGGGFGLTGIIPLLLLLGVFYVLILLPQRREKKKRKEMLGALKKNSKVQTIGGVIGTVTDIRDDEVTVKVDESSNVRMRFSRGAISQVLSEKEEE